MRLPNQNNPTRIQILGKYITLMTCTSINFFSATIFHCWPYNLVWLAPHGITCINKLHAILWRTRNRSCHFEIHTIMHSINKNRPCHGFWQDIGWQFAKLGYFDYFHLCTHSRQLIPAGKRCTSSSSGDCFRLMYGTPLDPVDLVIYCLFFTAFNLTITIRITSRLT